MKITARIALIAAVATLLGSLLFCAPTTGTSGNDAALLPPTTSGPSSAESSALFDALRTGDMLRVAPTPNPSWYGQGPYRHSATPGLLGASLSAPPPVYQASWSVPNWYVDPVAGDDTASCTSIGAPCKTYAQIAARWGTYSPRLRQGTTIDFLSSQPDNTDPVIWTPFCENGGYAVVMAELPTASQTGTLGTVTAKNRATPQLLQAILGAGGVAGQLVINTTHSSRAFLYSNPTGTTWAITQPLAPLTPPFIFSSGAEVDTWTTGDAFAVYSLFNVYVADISPVFEQVNSAFGTGAFVWQLNGFAPASSVTTIGFPTTMVESSFHAGIVMPQGITTLLNLAVNTYAASGFYTAGLPVGIALTPTFSFRAGRTRFVTGGPSDFSLDGIFDPGFAVNVAGGTISDLYVGSGSTLTLSGSTNVTGPIWGAGILNVIGSSRAAYPSSGGAAVANFLLTGGIAINGGSTACSHTGATPDVVSCGISITPAHLDAAQGAAGFGGLAYSPGGGSFSNAGL